MYILQPYFIGAIVEACNFDSLSTILCLEANEAANELFLKNKVQRTQKGTPMNAQINTFSIPADKSFEAYSQQVSSSGDQ
jgi:hypothetical protein